VLRTEFRYDGASETVVLRRDAGLDSVGRW
jgi:hypothetical protein